jgi:hypothetical protein
MGEKIYGRKAVLEALKSSSQNILGVYLLEDARGDDLEKIKAYAAYQSIPISLQSADCMKAMTEDRSLQEAIAIISRNFFVYFRFFFSRLYFLIIFFVILLFLVFAALGFLLYFLFLKS